MTKTKGRVAAASMSAGPSAAVGLGMDAKAIEQAMIDATLKAHKDGILDPDKILKLKLAARDREAERQRKAIAAASKAASK